jgi:hypothetical protein
MLYVDSLIAAPAASAAPTKPKRAYTPPGADGLDMYRTTGGDRRWGKGITDADYEKLSTATQMARAEVVRRGDPWPPPVAPTQQQQFAAWGKIGQHPTRK